MRLPVSRPVLALTSVLAAASPAAAQAPPDGARIYQSRCAACHERPAGQTPGRPQLTRMTPAAIVTALTSGKMAPMAAGLSPQDKQAVARFLTAAPPAGAARR